MPKLLLVEDNEVNRDCIARLLTTRGYEVLVARDGLEAVEMGLTAGADIILMDIGLPYKDGYEVTRELRAAGLTVPIVALTAHAMLYDRDMAFAAGCNAFETKPVVLKHLLGVLSAQLQDRPGVTPA